MSISWNQSTNMETAAHVTIEVWIKAKGSRNLWTLYDLPETRQKAEAIVLARRMKDAYHDYEIREIVSR